MIRPVSSNINFMKNYAVVGHTKPDLDSVSSAIAVSYLADNLKENQEDTFTPHVAGDINDETKFALSYFGVETPTVCEDFSLRASDIIKNNGQKTAKLSPDDSIEEFLKLAIEEDLKTLPVVENGKLKGVIARKDLAKFYFTKTKHVSELKEKNVPFSKIANLLEAEVIVGEDKLEDKVKGDVNIGAYSMSRMGNSDYGKDGIFIVGDRDDLQLGAIKNGAQALIITKNIQVKDEVIEEAKKQGTIILSTKFDVSSAIKSLEQSLPIEDIMTPLVDVTYFRDDEEVEKVKEVIQNSDHGFFPVLSEDGDFLGVIRKNDVINPEKKSFILVDHNAQSQYAKGVDEGEIKGIIDHHKIDCMPTGRIDSTFGTTGANTTLVYRKFIENNIEIPKELAGIMWLAIISDTDRLTSNTTTRSDIEAAHKLSQIAEVQDKKDVIRKMLETREFDLSKTSIKKVVEDDYKVAPTDNGQIFISQIKTSDETKYLDRIKDVKKTLNTIDNERSTAGSFAIITNYISKDSYVVASDKAINKLKRHLSETDIFEINRKIPDTEYTYGDIYKELSKEGIAHVKGGTSRKEQFQPFMVKIFEK